ncbi:uncharacterized protein DFL_003849 [Arthrobotrys flagrans]|uniref:Uncharacterized protein n=1 Tax=Arthrobotrys flagrans TaxID=97331 RepID=A0A437A311_ARTFL|nr:hypothetical protein DFL_003849 [Arthrobotrys flagrans]
MSNRNITSVPAVAVPASAPTASAPGPKKAPSGPRRFPALKPKKASPVEPKKAPAAEPAKSSAPGSKKVPSPGPKKIQAPIIDADGFETVMRRTSLENSLDTIAAAKGETKAVGEAPQVEEISLLEPSGAAEPSTKVSPSGDQVVSRLFSTLKNVDAFMMGAELNAPCSSWIEHQQEVVLSTLAAGCCQVEAALGQKDVFGLPGWSLFKGPPLTTTTARLPDILSGIEPLVSRRYKIWLNELGLSSFEVHFDPAEKRHTFKLFLRESFLVAAAGEG